MQALALRGPFADGKPAHAGLASSGRDRNCSTISSSSSAIALTCDFDRPVTPGEAGSFSTRRVEGLAYDVATTEASMASARRCSGNYR